MTATQHNAFTGAITAAGTETIVLTTAITGAAAIKAEVENYTLAAGTNSLTTAAANQTINANATTDGQVLTLAGTHNATVNLVLGDLTSTSSGDITVVATTGTNVITTAGGADTITGGAGADTIDVGAADDNVRDTVVFAAATDGAAAGAVVGHDLILDIDLNAGDATDDRIAFDGALETALDTATAGTFQTTNTDGGDGGNEALGLNGTDEITVLLDAEVEIAAADLTTAGLANLITELDEEIDFSQFTAGDVHLFAVNVSATQAGLILYTDDGGDDTIVAADLQLLGIVTHNDGTNLVAGDLVII